GSGAPVDVRPPLRRRPRDHDKPNNTATPSALRFAGPPSSRALGNPRLRNAAAPSAPEDARARLVPFWRRRRLPGGRLGVLGVPGCNPRPGGGGAGGPGGAFHPPPPVAGGAVRDIPPLFRGAVWQRRKHGTPPPPSCDRREVPQTAHTVALSSTGIPRG